MTAQVGRYELLTRLSGGGMGEVFLARVVGVEGFAKQVAVKRIYPDRSGDYQVRKLFVREAKLVAQLDHPNIVQVLELGADGDDLYMVMEFVQGVDLSNLLKAIRKSGVRLANEQILVLVHDVIAALEHAHAFIDEAQTINGIIHADVSPHNIMVTAQGFAKLCDFGVAKILRQKQDEQTLRGHWGKLAYMAPEQVREKTIDKRTDVYALGAVLYELFAGKRMLDLPSPEAMMNALINGDIRPLANARPDLAPLLCEVIQKACAMDADQRWESVADLRSALAEAGPPLNVAKARKELADLVRANRRPLKATPLPQPIADNDESASDSFVGDEPTRVIQLSAPLFDPPSEPRGNRLWLAMSGGAAMLALVLVVAVRIAKTDKPDEPPTPQPAAPLTTVAPSNASGRARRPAEPAAKATAVAMVSARAATPDAAVTPSAAAHAQAKAPTKPKAAPALVHDTAQSTEPAHLTINAVPWAHVTIDGVLIKDTPILNHPLAPGHHKVELRRPSGQKVELALDLRPGESIKKIIEFRPE